MASPSRIDAAAVGAPRGKPADLRCPRGPEIADIAGLRPVGAFVRAQTAAAGCARVRPAESLATARERGNHITGANLAVIRVRRKLRQPVS
jgi:hypothetical protein